MIDKIKYHKRWIAFIMIVIFMAGTLLPTKEAEAASKKKWYQIARTIMHAGGGIDKKYYTNSVEALNYTLAKGKRLIELDVCFTTDGVLVCNHDWKNEGGKRISSDAFSSMATEGGYTALTMEAAIQMLLPYKNAYLVIDSKEKDIAKVYKEIKRICVAMDQKQFLDRIVVQIYSKSDYAKVKKVYKFKNWNFTLYKIKPRTTKELKSIAAFCKKNKIQTVTLRHNHWTKSKVNIFKKYKIQCLAYTVNSRSTYKKLRKMGVIGIFTDFL